MRVKLPKTLITAIKVLIKEHDEVVFHFEKAWCLPDNETQATRFKALVEIGIATMRYGGRGFYEYRVKRSFNLGSKADE